MTTLVVYIIEESKNKLHVLVSHETLIHVLIAGRAAKAQTSLRIRAVSPESSRLTHTM